jgi:uncharacterized OsmC-like protein
MKELKEEQIAEQSVREQATEPLLINGVNVEQYNANVEAIRENPEIAKFQFRVSNEWMGGTSNRSIVKELYGACEEMAREKPFTLEMDEPPVLLGSDSAVNPVEAALSALAGCLTTTFVFQAAEQGVRIDRLESRIEGDVDLHGALGLDETVPTRLDKIRVSLNVKADASREKIRELVELAKKRSVVFDTINRGLPISVELT